MNPATEKPPTSREREGLDSGWPAFLAAAKAADPNFESYGVERLAADYAMLRTKLAQAMKHATGYESEELFKIGYILSIVQERPAYTIDHLAHVVSNDWAMPTGDLDLIGRVRDIMSLPCNFAEELSQSGFQAFVNHVDEPIEVQNFLERLDHVRTYSRNTPRTPILALADVKAVLYAEIWCTWAYEKRSPLPAEVMFATLFGPEIAVKIKAFARQLEKAFTCKAFKDYVLRWYGFDVVILRNIGALVDLVDVYHESA
ncbi:hypothetical protein GGR55DRAFT_216906 [Xylaria sp. FL0064]|nr:hypothetical protein GGR55DRAFT_216906 [Xylaria sp. FL0064]